MAEIGNEDPAVHQDESNPQDVGERMVSLETQVSQLTTLVTSLVGQRREQVESSVSAAPGGTGTEYGRHPSDATGGTAGGTGGDAQGLGVSD